MKFLAWDIISAQEIELLTANPSYREEGSILAVVLSLEMAFLLHQGQNVGEDKAWVFVLIKRECGPNWAEKRPLSPPF